MAVVIKVVEFANSAPCPIAGCYLEDFDFEAYLGRGLGDFTDDVAKAKRFSDFVAAMEYWRTVSRVRPVRLDGKPNRPLTAMTVTIEVV